MVERVILCRVRLFIKIFSNHSVIATTSVVLTVSPPQVLIKTLGRLPVSKSAAGVRTAATARRRAGRIPPSAAHGCGAQPASPHQLRCDSSAGKARLAAARHLARRWRLARRRRHRFADETAREGSRIGEMGIREPQRATPARLAAGKAKRRCRARRHRRARCCVAARRALPSDVSRRDW